MSLSVVIGAGGTGGHLMPALAIADALRAMRPEARIGFVGTRRGLEGALVPAAGYELQTIDVLPLARAMRARTVLVPAALARASLQSQRILRARRADVAIGMGGYPSLPVIAGARMLRIPSVLHEQNAVPGLANSLAARLTRNVAVAFEEAVAGFPPAARPRTIGMPMREAIARFDRAALRSEAMAAFGLDPARQTLLVFGGSQGSRRLNDAALGVVEAWSTRDDRQMILGAGRDHAPALAPLVDAARGAMPVAVLPAIERMELAYAASDVALCRAGAASVAELAATGVPSILVPYPHARRGEQAAHARAMARRGAAVHVRDAEATPQRIVALAGELLEDPQRLASMSAKAREGARPDAARDMAAWVVEIAEGGWRR